MRVAKGRSGKAVVLAGGASHGLRSLIVPGRGVVAVVDVSVFESAKAAAGRRFGQAVEELRNASRE